MHAACVLPFTFTFFWHRVIHRKPWSKFLIDSKIGRFFLSFFRYRILASFIFPFSDVTVSSYLSKDSQMWVSMYLYDILYQKTVIQIFHCLIIEWKVKFCFSVEKLRNEWRSFCSCSFEPWFVFIFLLFNLNMSVTVILPILTAIWS